jgi:hypothetical protein
LKLKLMVILMASIVSATSLMAADPAPPPAQAPAAAPSAPNVNQRRETYSDRYSVLTEHNIFMKDRARRPAATTQRATSQAAAPPLEASLVLRGIVMEEEGFRAYVENLESQNMLKIAIGDDIGHGKVSSFQIDAIEYARGDQKTWIEIGRNFLGAVSASVPTSAAPTTGPTSAAPGARSGATTGPVNANDPNLTPEQRMRLRRQQELKR